MDPSTDKKAKSVVLRLLSLSPVIFSALCLGALASIAAYGHEAQIGYTVVQRVLVDVVDVHTARKFFQPHGLHDNCSRPLS